MKKKSLAIVWAVALAVLLGLAASPALVVEACEPNPEGTGCLNVTCPIVGEICLPYLVNYDPTNGQVMVLECECVSSNYCHIEFAVGAMPYCVGGCPSADEECKTFTETQPDGTINMWCECVSTLEACCFPDGSCQDLDSVVCLQQGGTPQGPGTDCTTVDCPVLDDCDWEVEHRKWVQPFDPVLSGLHAHNDAAGNTIILADDWLCEGGRVTDLHWWGNYEPSGVAPNLDYFHLSIHKDIADPDPCDPRSWSMPQEPPERVINAPFAQVNETATGIFNSTGDMIYQYEYILDEPFIQEEGQVYWLDISAHSPDGTTIWRWQEAARSKWPDLTIDPAESWNSASVPPWDPIRWPALPSHEYDPNDRYSEMAFAITSDPRYPENTKWVQLPDVTTTGIDIDAIRPRTLADDFECTEGGLITDVHLWGSWQDDDRGKISNIHLSIHRDIPAIPGEPDSYSMPGPLLWEGDFGQGEFHEHLYHTLADQEFEYWWDPWQNDAPGQDQQIWQIDVCIDPNDAFHQLGTTDEPIIYWLDVQVQIDPDYWGDFGWKTSRKHWQDAAVWRVSDVVNWQKLTYPLWHQYETQNIDLAFVITGEKDCYVIGEPRGVCGEIITPANYAAWLTLKVEDREIWCCPYQPCGDANGDGYANPEDYLVIFANLGSSAVNAPRADVNHDGYVNPEDYLTVFANLGSGDGEICPPLP